MTPESALASLACHSHLCGVVQVDTGDLTIGRRLLGEGKNAFVFKLGAVALRNRAAAEEADGKTTVDERERAFFEKHPALRDLSTLDGGAAVLGMQALVDKLSAIQGAAVRAAVPTMMRAVEDQLEAAEAKLAELPVCITTTCEAGIAFLGLCNRAAEAVRDATLGRYSDSHGDVCGEASAMGVMPRLETLFDEFNKQLLLRSTPIFHRSYRVSCRARSSPALARL